MQYFDKGRMELNQPGGPVTAGLLAVELITGQQQDGDATFVAREPGRVTVAGDPDNPFPTYADLGRLRGREGANNVAAATPITKLYRPDGSFGVYTAATADPLAATTGYDLPTGHNIPRAFDDFRNAPGYGGLPAIGLAYTEPVWAEVKVAGQTKPVLMQAFERRVLTYTPSNPTGFKVEYGNIGQGYYRWRYQLRPGTPGPTPTPRPGYGSPHGQQHVAADRIAAPPWWASGQAAVTGSTPGTEATPRAARPSRRAPAPIVGAGGPAITGLSFPRSATSSS